jgi:peptidyl-dipeptidase Dcp
VLGLMQLSAEPSHAAAQPANLSELTTAWPGPYGGLPPVDRVTPARLDAAYRQAIDAKRAEIRVVASDPQRPTFENTIAPLEASGKALARVRALLDLYTSTASTDEIRAVAARVTPLGAGLDDEIAHDPILFSRVDAVFKALPGSAPTPEARRLVQVLREDMVYRGAALSASQKARLQQINERLAALSTQFQQNVAREEESLAVFVGDEAQLQGLNEAQRQAAKAAAQARGRANEWAIPIQRPSVWPVLTRADSRALREQVFRLWITRGDHRGTYDNAPVMKELLQLRGEKAKVLGFPTYADLATSRRMAGTPDVAMKMMQRAWDLLLPKTEAEIASLQTLAKEEGAKFKIEPWDRLYYAEKLRQKQLSLDSDAVKPYLTLDNVIDGMMWAAQRTYGLSFKRREDIPVISPDVAVYEVARGAQIIGVLYLDMFQRTGKGPSSWTSQYRAAERGPGNVLPVAALHSNVVHPSDGSPPLLAWEVANVIFHEFGHALHMLSNGAPYPSLGSLQVPWDFVEVPSLLNERWLLDRQVLSRFARHYKTGEPMPAELIAKVEQGIQHDRVFSVTLDYLATAMVDMKLHLMADGREIDAVAEEKKIQAQLRMPPAVAPTLAVSHAYHTFSPEYAAGVYTYLWSDAIAADIAEAFFAAPGGLYDQNVSTRYRRTILEAGNTRPMSDAFRDFRGRDPDPDALFRRFNLLPRE